MSRLRFTEAREKLPPTWPETANINLSDNDWPKVAPGGGYITHLKEAMTPDR